MKKFIPVIVVAAVLLLVLVVVASRKSVHGNNKKQQAVTSAMSAEVQKKNKTAVLMKEAHSAYDAKNYKLAITKTREVLGSVDNMSQEAKNLLQISQIRMMEQTPAAPGVPVAKAQTKEPVK